MRCARSKRERPDGTVLESSRNVERNFDATSSLGGSRRGARLPATYFAQQAVDKKMNIDAMFTNDIIGGVTSHKASPFRNRVRVFSEGVPSNETQAEANTRRSVGGENDSASRQLARFVKEQADRYLKTSCWLYTVSTVTPWRRHICLSNAGCPLCGLPKRRGYTHQHQISDSTGSFTSTRLSMSISNTRPMLQG